MLIMTGVSVKNYAENLAENYAETKRDTRMKLSKEHCPLFKGDECSVM